MIMEPERFDAIALGTGQAEDGIFAHPTLAEGLNALFTSMEK